MIRSIQDRQLGIRECRELFKKEELRRTYSLDFSHLKHFKSVHQKSVLSIDVDTSDERFLLSGGLDGYICIYDLQKTMKVGEELTFKPVVHIKRANHMQAPRSGVTSVAWNTTDTALFLTGSYDKRACVWDTSELVMVHAFRFDSEVRTVKMSPVNTLVAVGTGETEVSLCDLRLGEVAQVLSGHTAPISALAWSPGQEHALVSGSDDGSLRLWDLRKSNSMITFDYVKTISNSKKRGRGTTASSSTELTGVGANGRRHNPSATTRPETAHQGCVTDVAFLPDGTQILSTGADHMMRLWDATTGLNQSVHYPDIRNHAIHKAKISISNNGKIVYHPRNSEIIALEVETGKKIHTLNGHYSHVTALAFHRATPELYSASSDGQLLIWTPWFDEARYLERPAQNAVLQARRAAAAGGLDDDIDDVADWNSDEELF